MSVKVKDVVVVGCGGVGGPAAMMSKTLDESLNVTVIRDEENFLTRCAVPYIACGDVTVRSSVKSDDILSGKGVRLIQSKAVSIDRKEKSVHTADGRSFHYDKLVLAMGAEAALPPLEGVDLKGVFTLRTSRDACSVHSWANGNSIDNAVVIGAGAVGIETACLLAGRGIRVSIVEMLNHVLQASFDTDMSERVETYLLGRGISLKLGQRLARIMGSEVADGVELSSGERIPAGMVIIAGGAIPRVDLARKAGIEVGRRALKVNQYLQTSDPDVYAGGDLIEYESHVTGEVILGQIRPNAVIGGRIIAKNILGYKVAFPRLINAFCTKFFDMSVASTGITERAAREEGIDILSTSHSTMSMHGMMKGKKPYTLKLIFDKSTEQVIGAQIVGTSEVAVRYIDAVSMAIRTGQTVLDLTTFRCAGQPELSPEPSAEAITLASEAAFRELYKSGSQLAEIQPNIGPGGGR